MSDHATPTGLRNASVAASRFGSFGQRWLDAMWVGDPLADAVVADFERLGHGAGMRLLQQAIHDGIDAISDAPPSLIALFAQLDAVPPWTDRARCDRAADCIARHTQSFAFVLGAASLLAGAHNTIAGKPLTATGRYATQPGVRSIEVGAWLSAITTPGGLERDQLGFERTVRVRLIHAHVRSGLQRSGDWDVEAWGVPIPQAYMAFTLAEFGAIALRAMHQLGVRYTDQELADIYHLWRTVGRLVGMEDDLNPDSWEAHARIQSLFELTSPGPDDGDREFVHALGSFQVAELEAMLPRGLRRLKPVVPNVVHGLQRAFVGDRIASDLDIPASRLTGLPLVTGPVMATWCRAYDSFVPRGKQRRTARGYERRGEVLEHLRDRYGVHHDLVDAQHGERTG